MNWGDVQREMEKQLNEAWDKEAYPELSDAVHNGNSSKLMAASMALIVVSESGKTIYIRNQARELLLHSMDRLHSLGADKDSPVTYEDARATLIEKFEDQMAA